MIMLKLLLHRETRTREDRSAKMSKRSPLTKDTNVNDDDDDGGDIYDVDEESQSSEDNDAAKKRDLIDVDAVDTSMFAAKSSKNTGALSSQTDSNTARKSSTSDKAAPTKSNASTKDSVDAEFDPLGATSC
jgi:hypothetical protein